VVCNNPIDVVEPFNNSRTEPAGVVVRPNQTLLVLISLFLLLIAFVCGNQMGVLRFNYDRCVSVEVT
jgi:hypothetical protein